jgi:hypothetical protein
MGLEGHIVDMRRRKAKIIAVASIAAGTLLLSSTGPAWATQPRRHEQHHRCTVRSADTDRDHLPDCWERKNGLRVGKKDQNSDRDGDWLKARQEFGIDARSADGSLMQPLRANEFDSNHNHILDGREDLDGDGYTNLAEIVWKTDPLDPASVPDLTPLPDGCIPVPATIAADGSRDVTNDLQIVIDTVPDGSCIDFPTDARYRMDETLQIWWRHDLTLNGNGTKLFTNEPGPIDPVSDHSQRRHVVIAGGTNITFQGFWIDGPNPVADFSGHYEFEHGVTIAGVNGALVQDVKITHVYGDCVYFDDGADPPGSKIVMPDTNVLVTNITCHIAGRHGLGIGATTDGVTFDNNIVDGVGRSGVDIEPIPSRILENINITNNTFSNFKLNLLAGRGVSPVYDVYFGFNHVVGQPFVIRVGPTRLRDGSDPPFRHGRWTFEGNVSDTPLDGDDGAFQLQYIDDVTIIGNTQPFTPGAAGWAADVSFSGCNITIANNDFPGVTQLFHGSAPECNWVDGGGNITAAPLP